MLELLALAQQCAPNVAPETMVALIEVESSRNPFAIGVVDGALKRQPQTAAEAVATAEQLERQGRNFSMGIAQVNRYNLPKYGITYRQAFDPCTNMRVGALILQECYSRALAKFPEPQRALRASFSCYYSGNFNRGFRPDKAGDLSYVQKVVAAAGGPVGSAAVPRVLHADSLPRPPRAPQTGSVLFGYDGAPVATNAPAEPERESEREQELQAVPSGQVQPYVLTADNDTIAPPAAEPRKEASAALVF